MVLSAVGGIGGTVSAGAPWSQGRRQSLHPNAPLGDLLGWVSFSFGAHRSGVKLSLADKPTGAKRVRRMELLLLQLAF